MGILKEIFNIGMTISAAVLIIVLLVFFVVSVGASFMVVPQDAIVEGEDGFIDPGCVIASKEAVGNSVSVRPDCAQTGIDNASNEELAAVLAIDDPHVGPIVDALAPHASVADDTDLESEISTLSERNILSLAQSLDALPESITLSDSAPSSLPQPVRDTVINAVEDEFTTHDSWTSDMWFITAAGFILTGAFGLLYLLTILIPKVIPSTAPGHSPSP